MAWLQQLRFEGDPASQAVFDSYMLSIEGALSRRITVMRLGPGRRSNPRILV